MIENKIRNILYTVLIGITSFGSGYYSVYAEKIKIFRGILIILIAVAMTLFLISAFDDD